MSSTGYRNTEEAVAALDTWRSQALAILTDRGLTAGHDPSGSLAQLFDMGVSIEELAATLDHSASTGISLARRFWHACGTLRGQISSGPPIKNLPARSTAL